MYGAPFVHLKGLYKENSPQPGHLTACGEFISDLSWMVLSPEVHPLLLQHSTLSFSGR